MELHAHEMDFEEKERLWRKEQVMCCQPHEMEMIEDEDGNVTMECRCPACKRADKRKYDEDYGDYLYEQQKDKRLGL